MAAARHNACAWRPASRLWIWPPLRAAANTLNCPCSRRASRKPARRCRPNLLAARARRWCCGCRATRYPTWNRSPPTFRAAAPAGKSAVRRRAGMRLVVGVALRGGEFLVPLCHVHRLDLLEQLVKLAGGQGAGLREQQHLFTEHHQGGNRADAQGAGQVLLFVGIDLGKGYVGVVLGGLL